MDKLRVDEVDIDVKDEIETIISKYTRKIETIKDENKMDENVILPSKMKKIQSAVNDFVRMTFPQEHASYIKYNKIKDVILAGHINGNVSREKVSHLPVEKEYSQDHLDDSSELINHIETTNRYNHSFLPIMFKSLAESFAQKISTKLSFVVATAMALLFDLPVDIA